MSESNGVKSGVEPGDRVTIGITFGNSNSSIAFTVDDKAEVIANEDGGTFRVLWEFGQSLWPFGGVLWRSSLQPPTPTRDFDLFLLTVVAYHRPTNPHLSLLCRWR